MSTPTTIKLFNKLQELINTNLSPRQQLNFLYKELWYLENEDMYNYPAYKFYRPEALIIGLDIIEQKYNTKENKCDFDFELNKIAPTVVELDTWEAVETVDKWFRFLSPTKLQNYSCPDAKTYKCFVKLLKQCLKPSEFMVLNDSYLIKVDIYLSDIIIWLSNWLEIKLKLNNDF